MQSSCCLPKSSRAFYTSMAVLWLLSMTRRRTNAWTLATQFSSSHYQQLHRRNSRSSSSQTLLRSSKSSSSPVLSADEATTKTDITTQQSAAAATRIIVDDDSFVKPDRDLRKYRIIQLHNHLKVLLVSTQLSPGSVGTEAASVHVQAGHFDDTIPGLAHFHEHLLFLGTHKYPSEDEYEGFLQTFGGFSNAFTDMEDTNYYFSVTTEANGNQTSPGLQGGLDRLAQFFIAPTFDPQMVDREISAIDSEYRNALSSDAWRNFQLTKSTCDPSHPFAKFGCGNRETLTAKGLDYLLQELHTFWKTYYQTFNLRLSVVGHGSLDALQATVEETFGALAPSSETSRRNGASLPNQLFQRENAVYQTPAYTPAQLGTMRRILPLTEMRSIKLLFPTPPLDDPALDASKPYRTLSHVLGHEAPGSLHALLNSLGYIQGLSSGVAIDTSDFSLFSLSLSLTPKGMREQGTVLDLTFQWIALLRNIDASTLSDYHDELRQISEMSFKFRENGDPTDFCSSASELLFDDLDDPGRLLVSQSETSELNMDVVTAFMDRLRPSNCVIHVHDSDLNETMSSDGDGGEWMQEPWYGAKYRVERLAAEQMKEWEYPEQYDSRLQLPKLNEYIPTDFSLRCDDNADESKSQQSTATTETTASEKDLQTPPVLLVNTPQLRLWHKMDRYWRVPRAFIRLALLSPKIYSTPRTMTYSRIFQRVLNDDLNSFVYDASVAGCNYKVSSSPFGYRISVRGYSEKLPFLLDTLTTRILSLIEEMKQGDHVLCSKFDKAKESLLRETKNYRLDPPHEVAGYNSRLLLEENVFYLDNYIAEMEGSDAEKDPLNVAECATVVEECFKGRVQCEGLCMGNIDENGARVVANVLDRHFLTMTRGLSEAEMPRFRSMKLPTRDEAVQIFDKSVTERPFPVVYQDVAVSESEENNAVEVVLQAGCELDLGYPGIAILDLITHMAYNSAYSALRTKEQLGYIVSAAARKTAGGAWGMSVIVQGSVALPEVLEQRVEAWLVSFRNELEEMSAEDIADEASGVVSQLMEKEQKLSQEVGRMFGEILSTEGLSNRLREPTFDRLERLAAELTVVVDDVEEDVGVTGGEPGVVNKHAASSGRRLTAARLKERVLDFFDEHFMPTSPSLRAMSARVYNKNARNEYEAHLGRSGVLSSYSDMRHFKQYISTWPNVPYAKADVKF
ncbi:hypothetical protein MPSEU_000545400 [Mayamaea pseudoterrestris]|nr:hypothetical protein MPSEU_000545400 [Mayamaea pseudoterrestris]